MNIEQTMEHIVNSLRAAGHDPYEQLLGYLKTGEDVYITRTGDARSLIKAIPKLEIQRCVVSLSEKKEHIG